MKDGLILLRGEAFPLTKSGHLRRIMNFMTPLQSVNHANSQKVSSLFRLYFTSPIFMEPDLSGLSVVRSLILPAKTETNVLPAQLLSFLLKFLSRSQFFLSPCLSCRLLLTLCLLPWPFPLPLPLSCFCCFTQLLCSGWFLFTKYFESRLSRIGC